MNKIVLLETVAVCALTLAACGNANRSNSSANSSNSSSVKVVKSNPTIHAEKNNFIYPDKGKVEIIGFRKDTIKDEAITDVNRGESVYLVELKATNTSKKEMSIDDLTKDAEINFYQENNGSIVKAETTTGPESIASADQVDLYNSLGKASDSYDNKILPGKSATLLLPNVIHLKNEKSPLIIQAGTHDKSDKTINFKKDHITLSIDQLSKMKFNDQFLKSIDGLNSTETTDTDENKQSSSNSNKPSSSRGGASDANYDLSHMTLTEFVNKYGMSPAAYKIERQGMSEKDALTSTPDGMKSSGEMQTEYQMTHPNAYKDTENTSESGNEDANSNSSNDNSEDQETYDSTHMSQKDFDKKYVTVDMNGNPINGH